MVSNSVAITWTSDTALASCKDFLDIKDVYCDGIHIMIFSIIYCILSQYTPHWTKELTRVNSWTEKKCILWRYTHYDIMILYTVTVYTTVNIVWRYTHYDIKHIYCILSQFTPQLIKEVIRVNSLTEKRFILWQYTHCDIYHMYTVYCDSICDSEQKS